MAKSFNLSITVTLMAKRRSSNYVKAILFKCPTCEIPLTLSPNLQEGTCISRLLDWPIAQF